MSQVSYFQRFSQKENTATNNTLLLLKYFYQENPAQFERAINSLADDTSFSIGPQFEQQNRQGNSVPDGRIFQEPFEILIEAKDGQYLNEDQIQRHLSGKGEKTAFPNVNRLLVGLTTSPSPPQNVEKYKEMAAKYGTAFIAVTFADIVAGLTDTISDYDVHLQSVLDDYERYLNDDNLLPEGDIFFAIPCGISIDENVKHKIYFEPADRWSKARGKFIGFYAKKHVRFIDSPKIFFSCVIESGNFREINVELGDFNASVKKRVLDAIGDFDFFPNFHHSAHRYYLLDDVIQTNFKKISKGGIWGTRRFNVDELLQSKNSGELSPQKFAEKLRSKKFE